MFGPLFGGAPIVADAQGGDGESEMGASSTTETTKKSKKSKKGKNSHSMYLGDDEALAETGPYG